MAKLLQELKTDFAAGLYDQKLAELYMDASLVPMQRERYLTALERFEDLYGEHEVEIYSAPGRSEIGGNHTDHQYGKVLATSVNIDTIAVVAATGDDVVVMKSEGYPMIRVSVRDLTPDPELYGTTDALIRGVAAGMQKRGYRTGGFKGYATSQVLSGSGLSSSAAYEVLIGNIFAGLYNDGSPDAVTLAQIGQEAENVFFGKPCGLMDQMACSVGGLIHIDFADPESPVVSKVDVDFASFRCSLCITDTKASHADLTDEYAAVPAEMKQVAAFLGANVLSQTDEAEFYEKMPEIREAIGDRGVLRAIHYYNENRRVDAQKEALQSGDFAAFSDLVKKSGDSSFRFLQNVYASGMPQSQSVSVALAVSEQILGERGVCRVHGGGFAGTIQAFVPDDLVSEYKEKMDHVFGTGACQVLKVRNIGGTCVTR